MGEAAQLQLRLDVGTDRYFTSHFARREDESENEEACGIQG